MFSNNSITKFIGEYAFLSNFYECQIKYKTLLFNSAESAFQSCKCKNEEDKIKFTTLSPVESKKYGKRIQLIDNWDTLKNSFMTDIVYNKFNQNLSLKYKLLETYPLNLIEGNKWNDTYWGICNGRGLNILGKILMNTRKYFYDKIIKIGIIGNKSNKIEIKTKLYSFLNSYPLTNDSYMQLCLMDEEKIFDKYILYDFINIYPYDIKIFNIDWTENIEREFKISKNGYKYNPKAPIYRDERFSDYIDMCIIMLDENDFYLNRLIKIIQSKQKKILFL